MTATRVFVQEFAELQPVSRVAYQPFSTQLPCIVGVWSPGPNVQTPADAPNKFLARPSNGGFATIENRSVQHQMLISYYSLSSHRDVRRETMRSLLSYDMRDVPIMLGSATLAGSVADVVWRLLSSAPVPGALVIIAATTGVACGRILSHKARRQA